MDRPTSVLSLESQPGQASLYYLKNIKHDVRIRVEEIIIECAFHRLVTSFHFLCNFLMTTDPTHLDSISTRRLRNYNYAGRIQYLAYHRWLHLSPQTWTDQQRPKDHRAVRQAISEHRKWVKDRRSCAACASQMQDKFGNKLARHR